MLLLPKPDYETNAMDSFMFHAPAFFQLLLLFLCKMGECLLPDTLC